jgi:hypothetical protein
MNTVLNKVKIALGLMKFEDAVLVDGTKVSAEAFEPGMLLSVIAEDGTVSAAPEGRHETADFFITTDANGLIVSVEPKVAVETPVEAAVEMEEEIEVEVPGNLPAPVAEEVVQAVIDAISPALEEMANEIASMKKKMEEIAPAVEKVEEDMNKFKKAPGASKITTGPANLHSFAKENVEDFGSKINRLKAMTAGMNVKF